MSEMRRWLEPVDADWHKRALCRTERFAPDVWRLFDPVGLDEDKEDAWERASFAIDAYCTVCPVREDCRREGEKHLYEGVWGGVFRERRGVIDTDTGMVVTAGEPPAPTPPPPPPPVRRPPRARPASRVQRPDRPVLVDYETVTTRRGVVQYVLLTTRELLAAGNCVGV